MEGILVNAISLPAFIDCDAPSVDFGVQGVDQGAGGRFPGIQPVRDGVVQHFAHQIGIALAVDIVFGQHQLAVNALHAQRRLCKRLFFIAGEYILVLVVLGAQAHVNGIQLKECARAFVCVNLSAALLVEVRQCRESVVRCPIERDIRLRQVFQLQLVAFVSIPDFDAGEGEIAGDGVDEHIVPVVFGAVNGWHIGAAHGLTAVAHMLLEDVNIFPALGVEALEVTDVNFPGIGLVVVGLSFV